MINRPFDNDIDQQTRREILKDTYFNRAQSDADMIGGRFKQQTQTHVTGVPQYPKQPPTSPWATPDPSGPEPPLGYEIDALPDCGLGGAPAMPCVETATPNEGSDSAGVVTPQHIRRRL